MRCHGGIDGQAQPAAASQQAFPGADHLHLVRARLAELARRLGEHVCRPGDIQQLETGKGKDGDVHG